MPGFAASTPATAPSGRAANSLNSPPECARGTIRRGVSEISGAADGWVRVGTSRDSDAGGPDSSTNTEATRPRGLERICSCSRNADSAWRRIPGRRRSPEYSAFPCSGRLVPLGHHVGTRSRSRSHKLLRRKGTALLSVAESVGRRLAWAKPKVYERQGLK